MPDRLHFSATEPTAPVVIVKWMTEMQTEVAQKHGKMSSIFNYKNPAYPPEPQPINVVEGASVVDIAMATKQAEGIIGHRIKMEELRAKVFGDVVAGLSMSSLDALQRTSGFDALRTNGDDPLELVRHIITTHLTAGSTIPGVNKKVARDAFNAVKMTTSETITESHLRFTAAIMAMPHVGVPVATGPAGAEVTDMIKFNLIDLNAEAIKLQFVNNLDPNRYSQAVQNFMNGLTGRTTFQSLEDAYGWARKFKVVTASQPAIPATAMVVATSTQQADRSPGGSGCEQCGSTEHRYYKCKQELTTKAALDAKIAYMQRLLDNKERIIKKLRAERGDSDK